MSVRDSLNAEGLPVQPLEHQILVDTFEDSRSGWYLHYHDDERYDLDWGVVCRSTMPTHWFGSHGGHHGQYSLKVATRPESGRTTNAIKRMTMPYFDGQWYETLRFETVFTYHEEPRGTHTETNTPPEKPALTGESNVRSFAFQFDLHNREHRWWPAVRYLNFDGEEKHAKWQYSDGGIDPALSEFVDVPDGTQALCWNSPNDSIPWKANWHYLRIDLDMANLGYRELQCNDAIFDMQDFDLEPSDPVHDDDNEKVSPWPDIDGLLNPLLTIQTNKDTRSFLFFDTISVSAATSSGSGR